MTTTQAEDAFVKIYGKWQAEAWRTPRTLKYRLLGNPFQSELEKAAKDLEQARKERGKE